MGSAEYGYWECGVGEQVNEEEEEEDSYVPSFLDTLMAWWRVMCLGSRCCER